MKKSSNNTLLYSIIGTIIILIIIVIVNILGMRLRTRIDFTQGKVYTLSQGTKNILNSLKDKIEIRFYFSSSNPRVPAALQSYARQVEDLLNEYKHYSNHIKIIKLDPSPDSDAEDSAIMDNIQRQDLKGDYLYFGLSIANGRRRVSLPVLSMARQNLLEYEITHAITQVIEKKRVKVGIISALPVMGGAAPQALIQRGIFQLPRWFFISELAKSYQLQKIPMSAGGINDDIDLIVLIHPAGISKKLEYALDQFVLRGGRLVVFLDPFSVFATQMSKTDPTLLSKQRSTLPNLLKAWGIQYNDQLVVTDLELARRVTKKQENYISVLDITEKQLNKKDVITSQLRRLMFVLTGAFEGTPKPGIKKSVLVHSTKNSCLMAPGNGVDMLTKPGEAFKRFKADPLQYDLAIRLDGTFKTAFPKGLAGSKKKQLTQSIKPGHVILIGDTDLLYEQFNMQVQQVGKQKVMIPLNNNYSFAQNIVDFFGGDTNLISIRCRGAVIHPFIRINKMLAKAEERFKEKVLKLRNEAQKTQARLNELQRQRKPGEQLSILTPEQKKARDEFVKKNRALRRQLKELRKELRQDINSLKNKIRIANILLFPLLLIFLGISVWIYRQKRSSAK